MVAKDKAIADARSICLSRLHNSDAYKAAVARLKDTEAQYAAAKEGADPYEKLNASSAVSEAKAAVAKLEITSVSSDHTIAQATTDRSSTLAQSADASLRLAKLLEEKEKLDAAAFAKQQEKEKAEEYAKRDERARIVTNKQLEIMGEKFVGQRVKCIGTFLSSNNIWVDQMPGVALSSDGLVTIVATKELEKWVGFSIKNANGTAHSSFLFVMKEAYGDLMVKLQPGQALVCYGTVVKLQQAGWYGVVCDEIVVGKDRKATSSK